MKKMTATEAMNPDFWGSKFRIRFNNDMELLLKKILIYQKPLTSTRPKRDRYKQKVEWEKKQKIIERTNRRISKILLWIKRENLRLREMHRKRG